MLEFLEAHYWSILIVVNYLLAITAMVTILLNNVNPSKTLSYLIILALFPFFGLVIYYLFGRQYRKTKIFDRKHIANSEVIKSISHEFQLGRNYLDEINDLLDDKVKLIKLIDTSERSPLTLNNQLTILRNGETKFEALLQDLKNAKDHIHLEYYILRDDQIGTEVLEQLCQKAEQGLEVKLTYDDVGSKLSGAMKRKLSSSGVNHKPFMPVFFSSLTGKSNYRNHRKVVVIDGQIGYLGGINISDNYINTKDSEKYWRDTHLRVEGDVVKVLQFHFLTTWDFVTEDKLQVKSDYFPEFEVNGKVPVQIAASGPDTDWANIMEAMLTAINNAERYIFITTPYFIPNPQILTALQVAARIGVDVRLLIPKDSDSWIAKHATNSFLEYLLSAGVKVYRYEKGFIHAKTMVVDDVFSTVGTCNLDNRSFNINFEINALIYDEDSAAILRDHFEEDLKSARKIKSSDWSRRSKWQQLCESFSRLWSPLL